ncbi:hypothetical protein, partial [Pseudoalteromonas sp. SG41-5]|uniref:hypothetical protein n=1 Tax=Pseudoalteromonas sp. SG41-5 TaxID=2760975 RepID=UPI001C724DC0
LAYSSFCCALSVTFDFLVIVIPFGFSSFYAINLSSFIRPLQSGKSRDWSMINEVNLNPEKKEEMRAA